MELTPWKPIKDLIPLRKEIDNLFKRFLGEGSIAEALGEGWMPSVDVSETDEGFFIRAEIPGLEAGDIDVSIVGDRLTIKGEKRKEEEKSGEHFHSVERYYGSFQRSFTLPASAQSEKTEASFEKGVLKISIPKSEEAKSKSIKVEVR
ncbi:MAG: Hsp20/alpha crystallin family protein [Syntrophobacteraceae bacterium]|jgi:HSP20 family protein|nr:Hsp20/alpha crystallin family protein [Syntrophobacteraceae bacterium]